MAEGMEFEGNMSVGASSKSGWLLVIDITSFSPKPDRLFSGS